MQATGRGNTVTSAPTGSFEVVTPVEDELTAEQRHATSGDAVTGRGRFVVVEGLAGVGKSTVAPLLAAALGADLVDTQLPELAQARRYTDASRSVHARLHFWMMANYVVSDVVRRRLRAGRSVVIESYFYRTLATHGAMGALPLPAVNWDQVMVPDLAIELTLHEPLRQRRLAGRERSGPSRYWDELTESGLATLRDIYDSFSLTPIDATDLTPDQVVNHIVGLLTTPHAEAVMRRDR